MTRYDPQTTTDRIDTAVPEFVTFHRPRLGEPNSFEFARAVVAGEIDDGDLAAGDFVRHYTAMETVVGTTDLDTALDRVLNEPFPGVVAEVVHADGHREYYLARPRSNADVPYDLVDLGFGPTAVDRARSRIDD